MSFIKKFNNRLPEKWDLTTKWTWVVIIAWLVPFLCTTGLLIMTENEFTGTMFLTSIIVYILATIGLGVLFTALIVIFRTIFD